MKRADFIRISISAALMSLVVLFSVYITPAGMKADSLPSDYADTFSAPLTNSMAALNPQSTGFTGFSEQSRTIAGSATATFFAKVLTYSSLRERILERRFIAAYHTTAEALSAPMDPVKTYYVFRLREIII